MGSGDDMESNASSFMLEMKETAAIVKRATPLSFVLIDELGRSTSNEDGVGVAWAVCEHFVRHRINCLFVTHYHQLSKLATMYPRVKNVSTVVHLADGDGDGSGDDDGDGGLHDPLRFLYKVADGPLLDTCKYGIALAKACGVPKAVVDLASRIRRRLESDARGEAGVGENGSSDGGSDGGSGDGGSGDGDSDGGSAGDSGRGSDGGDDGSP